MQCQSGKDLDCMLDSEELALISRKRPQTQLAFALMLKFFQIENKFPNSIQDISMKIIESVSNQLNRQLQSIEQFDWNGRSSERFRSEIRVYFGYRKATVSDCDNLIQWLIKKYLPEVLTFLQCREFAVMYFRQQKIELFSTKELDRHIKSAQAKFEDEFFKTVSDELTNVTFKKIDALLTESESEDSLENQPKSNSIKFQNLKKDIGEAKLKNIQIAIEKIDYLETMELPYKLLKNSSRKLLMKYYRRIMAEHPSHIQEHDTNRKLAMMAIFFYIRSQLLIDSATELLLQLIHKLENSSENSIKQQIISEVTRVNGKFDILCKLSSVAAEKPTGIIQQEIYPIVSQETLTNISVELKSRGKWYQTEVKNKMRSLYAHGSRRLLLKLLEIFRFRSNRIEEKSLLDAIEFIKQNQNNVTAYSHDIQTIPMIDVLSSDWYQIISESNSGTHSTQIKQSNKEAIDYMHYEVMILNILHDKLQCKAIWIDGAHRYRNPDEDMPKDFDENEEFYFKLLNLPIDAYDFTKDLKNEVSDALKMLNQSIPNNPKVKIVTNKKGSRFRVSPSEPQTEPTNLGTLNKEVQKRWSSINLIDIVKESELRIGFSKHCTGTSRFQKTSEDELRKRLLLCFYGIGSNIGLKRLSAANAFVTESDLHYTKRRHINVDNVRAAIVDIINETIAIRDPTIWGESTTGVACDSKHINCWDQNLLTQWHGRYRKHGVMVYWHIDTKSLCIYSQLKTCISSEVGSMLNGILKHCSQMNLKKSYVDTHGQSTIGFGFSYCLHFDLLPRFKGINKQKLFVADIKDKKRFSNLESVIAGSINWDKIEKSYKEVVKHIAALKIGMVDADVLIKRFGKNNEDHPVYQAFFEIGKAAKTIFLCYCFAYENLRIEIHEALNVVERLNSVMHFIFYGKLGEITNNDKEEQELSIVCLHLLQACMVYINTLMIQEILSEPEWKGRLQEEDKRALTPLLHGHINPYGLVSLDMGARLIIEMLQKIQQEQNSAELEEVA
jgi:TnpA family transposase